MGKLNNECNKFSNVEKTKFHSRYNISDLFVDDYDHSDWFAMHIT